MYGSTDEPFHNFDEFCVVQEPVVRLILKLQNWERVGSGSSSLSRVLPHYLSPTELLTIFEPKNPSVDVRQIRRSPNFGPHILLSSKFQMFGQERKIPDRPIHIFTVEPQNPSINKFYVVQKSHGNGFGSSKLRKGRSGHSLGYVTK